mgnify:CR=1 FL=1
MRYLTIGLIFAFFTAGSFSNVTEEIHDKCKEANDYIGCVKIFSGGGTDPATEKEQGKSGVAPVIPPPETVGLGSFQLIKVGDSKQSVLEKVGSPNIISSSEGGGELWIYDKISRSSAVTTANDTKRKGLIFRAERSNDDSRVAQSSSSTMMSTIYFDSQDKVTDIKYRSTRY